MICQPCRNCVCRKTGAAIEHVAGGTLDNDSVSGWQFSLSEPLNFPYAPHYDLRQKNARLYGGLMIYAVNNPRREVSEGMLNANHEMRDDFNFMGLGPNQPIPPEEPCEAYAVWFWQKADFLNGGAEHPVRFDAGNFLAVHVSRYWGGLDAGRWVVRDGDGFYVSREAKKCWSPVPPTSPRRDLLGCSAQVSQGQFTLDRDLTRPHNTGISKLTCSPGRRT